MSSALATARGRTTAGKLLTGCPRSLHESQSWWNLFFVKYSVEYLSPLYSLIVEPVARAPTTRLAAKTVTAAVTTKSVAKPVAGT